MKKWWPIHADGAPGELSTMWRHDLVLISSEVVIHPRLGKEPAHRPSLASTLSASTWIDSNGQMQTTPHILRPSELPNRLLSGRRQVRHFPAEAHRAKLPPLRVLEARPLFRRSCRALTRKYSAVFHRDYGIIVPSRTSGGAETGRVRRTCLRAVRSPSV